MFRLPVGFDNPAPGLSGLGFDTTVGRTPMSGPELARYRKMPLPKTPSSPITPRTPPPTLKHFTETYAEFEATFAKYYNTGAVKPRFVNASTQTASRFGSFMRTASTFGTRVFAAGATLLANPETWVVAAAVLGIAGVIYVTYKHFHPDIPDDAVTETPIEGIPFSREQVKAYGLARVGSGVYVHPSFHKKKFPFPLV